MISSFVLAPLVLAAVWFGGSFFAVLLVVMAVISFWEWTAITGVAAQWLRIAGSAALAGGLFALHLGAVDWAIGLLAVPALVALALGFLRRDWLWAALGLLYAATPTAGMMLLRAGEGGLRAIVFIFLVVWASDIAAYFGGRAIGGPKLWPRVSPNKTWSGALSGLAAAAALGALVVGMTDMRSAVPALFVAAALSVASQGGDLLESALKRRFGVKDSGRIIPGHGGVLDRIDGLYGAAALAFLLAAVGLGGSILRLPAAG